MKKQKNKNQMSPLAIGGFVFILLLGIQMLPKAPHLSGSTGFFVSTSIYAVILGITCGAWVYIVGKLTSSDDK